MSKNVSNECGGAFSDLIERLEVASNPDTFDQHTLKELAPILRQAMELPQGTKAIDAWSKRGFLSKAGVMSLEMRISGMLSGIKTQLISPISGVVTPIFKGLEQYIGGHMLAATSSAKDAEIVRTAALMELKGVAGTLSSFQTVARAWKGGWSSSGGNPFAQLGRLDNPMDGFSNLRLEAVSRAVDGKDDSITAGMKILGMLSEAPGKSLEAGDAVIKLAVGHGRFLSAEFERMVKAGIPPAQASKQAADAAERMVKSSANTRKHLETALTLTQSGREIPKEIGETLANLGVRTADDIAGTLDSLNKGIRSGEEATFTHVIGDEMGEQRNWVDGVGKAANNAVTNVPALSLFLPFRKTPTNIASATWERTVGTLVGTVEASVRGTLGRLGIKGGAVENNYFDFAKRLRSDDARTRAQALGQFAVASTAAGAIWTLMSNDTKGTGMPTITGTGPANGRIRNAWKMAGWQPRSILVGDRYVSYDRLDPIAGAILGFTADIHDSMQLASDDGTLAVDSGDLFFSVMAAAGSNITSKTWMKGMSTLMDLAVDPTKEGIEKAARDTLGGFVPSAVNMVRQVEDPLLRDMQTIGDRVMGRIPGQSGKLDPRRNVLGETMQYSDTTSEAIWNSMMPFAQQRVKDSAVDKEFANLAHGFTMPSTKLGDIDLRDPAYSYGGHTAYDRLGELTGEVAIGGSTLRQKLKQIIASQKYQNLDTLSISGETNPRADLLQKTINKYRRKAKNQLLRERPQISADYTVRRQQRKNRKRGLRFDL